MSSDVAYRRGPLEPAELREPPFARFLFADTRASILWLIVRLYLGYEWLSAGIEKINSPLWTGGQAGVALTGFVNGALAKTGGEHPNVQGWYGSFLQSFVLPNAGLWSNLVAYGETLVGIALIVGALTGVAAFFGIVMNANYLLAGAVSTNPILIILGTLVMLAWRNAGWLGLDRWLLPLLGTPWQPGSAFGRARREDAETPATAAPIAPAYEDGHGRRREGSYDTGAARDYGAPVEAGYDETRRENPDLGDASRDEAATTERGSSGDGGDPLV